MKKKVHLIRNTFGITLLLFFSSCRSADSDDNLMGNGSSAVSFNLLGSEFDDSGKLANQASLSTGNLLNYANPVQHHSVLISPSSIIIAELSPSNEPLKVASLNVNSTAAISGNPITSGVKFRVIAYRQSNGNYHTHQDYTVGQPAAPMMLDNGAAYNIIVYSYGTTNLPLISSGEQSNLSSALVNYDDNQMDFMYQKIPFTPVNSASTLNITLRHKIAQITAIVNSGNLGNITNITGGLLTPHFSNGVVSLSSGTMSGRTTSSTGAVLNFSGFNTTTSTSNPVFVNADTNGNATGGFSAHITIEGITKTVSLPNSFKITPENKSNLTINLKTCGAYIGPNTNPANYKEFMCHNLGANTSADPFTPAAAVHGAKYQWGAQTGEDGKYVPQYYDQLIYEVNGWNGTVKPIGSWGDTSKTVNDPCPPGYRVPTRANWDAAFYWNKRELVGSWVNNGNYTSALYLINPSNIRTLMLPAAGFRSYSGGIQLDRGSEGYYWSSTEGEANSSYNMRFNQRTEAMMPKSIHRANAAPVRCIAE
ncbi:fibrobacter succinogenes major paralogous domain-containing protein [Elizabethkingia meningoseptica]|uniref:fibrobacter succinogenes major paralogous domain-containing protein n=1 Tax=Elizabethkingia meningoseptica TaxID=238 RepID=UPI00201197A4|nr:fibrobacter succinogenes major paralogous domain-containing protein [Elizabethkingia meningoseptica]MCL1674547.1 fibrobacter succinogenes major paralogous domain-containing protein [Elizabethkingia meningoseptica]MCL1686254.1 fibrobacter succinogenes major paralogous domain-containing protein [Elizabethkingia meningoseptica]MDE5491089.1 fibrobacter succinogenes major paralogous domain-containing protein [Elizabethkingia meningoseptica]